MIGELKMIDEAFRSIAWLSGTSPTERAANWPCDAEFLIAMNEVDEGYYLTPDSQTTEELMEKYRTLKKQVPRSAAEMLSVTYAILIHCL